VIFFPKTFKQRIYIRPKGSNHIPGRFEMTRTPQPRIPMSLFPITLKQKIFDMQDRPRKLTHSGILMAGQERGSNHIPDRLDSGILMAGQERGSNHIPGRLDSGILMARQERGGNHIPGRLDSGILMARQERGGNHIPGRLVMTSTRPSRVSIVFWNPHNASTSCRFMSMIRSDPLRLNLQR